MDPKLEEVCKSVYTCGIHNSQSHQSMRIPNLNSSTSNSSFKLPCLFCNIEEEDRVCFVKETDCVMIRNKPVFWPPCNVCRTNYSTINMKHVRLSTKDVEKGLIFKKKHGQNDLSKRACEILEAALEYSCKQFYMEHFLAKQHDGFSREFLLSRGSVSYHARDVSQDMSCMFERDRNPMALQPLHMNSFDTKLKNEGFKLCDPRVISASALKIEDRKKMEKQSMCLPYLINTMNLELRNDHLIDPFALLPLDRDFAETYRQACEHTTFQFVVVRSMNATAWAFDTHTTNKKKKVFVLNAQFISSLRNIETGSTIYITYAHMLTNVQMYHILKFCKSARIHKCTFYGYPCGEKENGTSPFLFFAQTLGLADLDAEDYDSTSITKILVMIDTHTDRPMIDQFSKFLDLEKIYKKDSVGILSPNGTFEDDWTFMMGVESPSALMHAYTGWPDKHVYNIVSVTVHNETNKTGVFKAICCDKSLDLASRSMLRIERCVICKTLLYRLSVVCCKTRLSQGCALFSVTLVHKGRQGQFEKLSLLLAPDRYYYFTDEENVKYLENYVIMKDHHRHVIIQVS